jgi:biopolymer transport protein ExbD
MKKNRRLIEDEAPGLDISSLVDVSFLLLVFFLVTSTIQRSEADLASKLGGNPLLSDGVEPYMIEIDLDKEGVIRVDGDVVDGAGSSALSGRLKEIVELARLADVEPLAVIRADDDAPHQRLIDIVDAMKARGIKDMTLDGFAE